MRGVSDDKNVDTVKDVINLPMQACHFIQGKAGKAKLITTKFYDYWENWGIFANSKAKFGPPIFVNDRLAEPYRDVLKNCRKEKSLLTTTKRITTNQQCKKRNWTHVNSCQEMDLCKKDSALLADRSTISLIELTRELIQVERMQNALWNNPWVSQKTESFKTN